MNHTIQQEGKIYTCPACSFRATATTRGLIVTVHADDAAHLAAIAQAQEARRAWAERVVTRLRASYEGRRALPEQSFATTGPYDDYDHPPVLTLQQLQRLMRYVIAEYSDG